MAASVPAIVPRMSAHVFGRVDLGGEEAMMARLVRKVARREARMAVVTARASRRFGGGAVEVNDGVEAERSLWVGKKVKNSSTMNIKQAHCNPICAIPNSAAARSPPFTTLQHPISARLCGKTRMFPIAAMLDSPPSRTHHGERPSEERRVMILMCCGR